MEVKDLLDVIGADFYTGVPDSQLKALCDYLVNVYGTDKKHHIIAANEGRGKEGSEWERGLEGEKGNRILYGGREQERSPEV